jgi:hypothetical protein
VQEVLQEAQLGVPPDERGFESFRAPHAADLGDDAASTPGRHRRRLALQDLLPCRLVCDRVLGGLVGRFADEHRSRRRDGLQPAGRVDEVARDHALADRPNRHRSGTGQDPGPSLDERPSVATEPADHVHEIERRSDRALGVVLVRDGGTPDGHDGIADELLDRAAVATDDLAAQVEVAGQQLPDRLGIAVLRKAGEPDQVGEQYGDAPPLAGARPRLPTRIGRRPGLEDGRGRRRDRRSALAAEPRGRLV